MSYELLLYLFPNALGMLCIVEFLLLILYMDGRFSIAFLFYCVPAFIVLLFVVKTRTAALIIAFGLTLLVATNVWKRVLHREEVTVSRILSVLTIVFAVMGIALVVLYGVYPTQLGSLDDLLSRRLSYAYSFLNNYSLTALGQHVELIGTIDAFVHGVDPLVLDNAYIHSLICQGVLPFCYLVFIYSFCVARKDRRVGAGLRIAVCMLSLVGISETLPITLLGSFPLASVLTKTDDSN